MTGIHTTSTFSSTYLEVRTNFSSVVFSRLRMEMNKELIRDHIKITANECSESTVCPGSLGQIYILTYYINWVKTSWIDSIMRFF